MIELVEGKYQVSSELEAYRSRESDIAAVMIGAISTHTNDHDGFTALEHNPEQFPFQRADCIAVNGESATVSHMRNLAPLLFPDFDKTLDRFMDSHKKELEDAGNILKSGRDIVVATDHRQVIAVAINSCLFTAALYESDNARYGDFNTEIAVSAMLRYTQIHNAPAMEIMEGVYDVIRIVVPTNNPNNKAKLPEGYTLAANTASVESRKIYDAKPKVTALAPSATGDIKKTKMPKRANPQAYRYFIGPPTDGTVNEYLTDTAVMATGGDLDFGGDGIFFGKLHDGRDMKGRLEALAVLQEIANGMSNQTGVESIFVPDVAGFQAMKSSKILRNSKKIY